MHAYFGDVWLTRLLVQRGMAVIYLVAFIAVVRQFKPLLGENGLLPVPAYLRNITFRTAPSVFCWGYSDRMLTVAGWTGLLISSAALFGLTEAGPVWTSIAAWLLLWVLYLSIVNVGQKFFAFGWESMVLEAGFFTAFLGPAHMQPSILPMLILRWMLFRTEMGAGLIKLRHDRCWHDLTCLFYHYETQPLPNPLSWHFHRIPRPLHKFSAVMSHFVQIVAPFGLFAPQPVAAIAGALIIVHQFVLIVSGNYSWLNWLTVILGVTALDDRILHFAVPLATPGLATRPFAFEILLYIVAAGTVALSYQPVKNLLSKKQVMNYSYNPFHLVNTYGAFGNVGRERYEIVMEGTSERVPTPHTEWKEYGFKAKPGDPKRMPPQIAPYHLRLDWLIWFLPFTVVVLGDGIRVHGYSLWFLRFVQKLLSGDQAILALMGSNPFPMEPPAFVRALFYRYSYTGSKQKRDTGAWWTRELLGVYLQPVSLEALKDL